MKETKTNAAECGTSTEPITYAENDEAITITIQGKAYENLRRIADAMNAASWTDNDHTPAWAVQYWIGSFLDRLAETPETCRSENITELTANIADNIDTSFEEGTPEDKTRRDELRAAFEAVGL